MNNKLSSRGLFLDSFIGHNLKVTITITWRPASICGVLRAGMWYAHSVTTSYQGFWYQKEGSIKWFLSPKILFAETVSIVELAFVQDVSEVILAVHDYAAELPSAIHLELVEMRMLLLHAERSIKRFFGDASKIDARACWQPSRVKSNNISRTMSLWIISVVSVVSHASCSSTMRMIPPWKHSLSIRLIDLVIRDAKIFHHWSQFLDARSAQDVISSSYLVCRKP